MEATIKCRSCGRTNKLPVDAEGDIPICDFCRKPLRGLPAKALLDLLETIGREWEDGILTTVELESFISAKAKEWLVAQGWITPEMDKEIESRLIPDQAGE